MSTYPTFMVTLSNIKALTHGKTILLSPRNFCIFSVKKLKISVNHNPKDNKRPPLRRPFGFCRQYAPLLDIKNYFTKNIYLPYYTDNNQAHLLFYKGNNMSMSQFSMKQLLDAGEKFNKPPPAKSFISQNSWLTIKIVSCFILMICFFIFGMTGGAVITPAEWRVWYIGIPTMITSMALSGFFLWLGIKNLQRWEDLFFP